MDPNEFPTKGNLMLAKNSLGLAKQGHELMDKKEKYSGERADGSDRKGKKHPETEIDVTFTRAYRALQKANIELGINYVDEISHAVPVENSIRIKTRSIMGTEIPLVEYEPSMDRPTYSFFYERKSGSGEGKF